MTAILDISRMISISISRNKGCWQDLESEDPGTGPFLQQLRLSVLSALGREGRATWAGWGVTVSSVTSLPPDRTAYKGTRVRGTRFALGCPTCGDFDLQDVDESWGLVVYQDGQGLQIVGETQWCWPPLSCVNFLSLTIPRNTCLW